MIAYVTVGADDMTLAETFYSAFLPALGYRLEHYQGDLSYILPDGPDAPHFYIKSPFNGETASAGNGAMVALNVGSKEEVDALHAKALSLGAADEGAPGNRTDTFYGGYFRDMDGNKLVVFTAV